MFMLVQSMEKICIMNFSIKHSFEKNETATIFFLKKPSLVWKNIIIIFGNNIKHYFMHNMFSGNAELHFRSLLGFRIQTGVKMVCVSISLHTSLVTSPWQQS